MIQTVELDLQTLYFSKIEITTVSQMKELMHNSRMQNEKRLGSKFGSDQKKRAFF